MTQVPASSHGGGGTFNGGTITEPLVIDLTAKGAQDITGLKLLLSSSWPYGANEGFSFKVGTDEPFGFIVPSGKVSTGGFSFTTDGGPITATGITGTGAVQTVVGATQVAAIDPTLGVVTGLHAAPADGDIQAGQLCLWFDQTNGASKAMFKGKSADGTVVAATVALA